MKAIWTSLILLVLSAALSGCAPSPDKEYLDYLDPGRVTVGDWEVNCIPRRANAAGRITVEPHCRIEKYDFLTLASIDATGIHIRGGFSDHYCPGGVAGLGVDGRSIAGLSLEAKVAALKSGHFVARENEDTWPYCERSSVEETSLAGFAQAYDIMLARWRAMAS